jgi:RNA polymerase sigma-B factor
MTAQGTRPRSGEALWSEYRAHPSPALREQLVERYRPLAMAVLRRLHISVDEDLEQVALLALVKAVDRFDPALGHQFSSFAVPTILGELKRYQRDQSRQVRCPRKLYRLHCAVIAKQADLAARSQCAPTLAEVADELGVGVDQVVEAMAAEDVCRPCSLIRSRSSQDLDEHLSLEECLGAEDPAIQKAETRIAWRQVIDELKPRLRDVIRLRYYQNMTQQQAAERLGVSQMHVSRLERRALDRLRHDAPVG